MCFNHSQSAHTCGPTFNGTQLHHRKRSYEVASAAHTDPEPPYTILRGHGRRIRLQGTPLLHIQPQLVNVFNFAPATCAALPGACTCTSETMCAAPLPPTMVAFDSPPLGDEELVYVLATLQHRMRVMLDPDFDDRRPLPDGCGAL